MLKAVHADILCRALNGTFSSRALEIIIAVNLGQDNFRGWIGHDEWHFDNNAFDKSQAYIDAQRALIRPALEKEKAVEAWQAFGRLTHAAQDFYAHSNYVDLWLAGQSDGERPIPEEIEPLDPALLHSPALRSGKLYYPLEALSFIPGLNRLVIPLLPHDSHAKMNLDSGASGPRYEYAFQAAQKRTNYEYHQATRDLRSELSEVFQDL